MLTGSECTDSVEPFGVLIVEMSGGEEVQGLSKTSWVTWRISLMALFTSAVRGRSADH